MWIALTCSIIGIRKILKYGFRGWESKVPMKETVMLFTKALIPGVLLVAGLILSESYMPSVKLDIPLLVVVGIYAFIMGFIPVLES